MSESTDARALLALGQPVTLANGEVRRLKITNAVMLQIEDTYGSTVEYLQVLRTKYLRHTAWLFSAAFGVSFDEAIRLIEMPRLQEYFGAIVAAMYEALGIDPEETPGEAPSQPDESPGGVSSTSPSPAGTSTLSASGK